jgi:hypothetical protein
MENTLNGEKILKLSISRFLREQHAKMLDPLFQSKVVLIEPKNRLTLLSL